jgi:hypothetical protein
MEAERRGEGELEQGPHFVAEPELDDVQAWEQIENGRYMPRRIRGSYRGRALG